MEMQPTRIFDGKICCGACGISNYICLELYSAIRKIYSASLKMHKFFGTLQHGRFVDDARYTSEKHQDAAYDLESPAQIM